MVYLSYDNYDETDIPEKLANGTVDSRQSFAIYTEAAAAQVGKFLFLSQCLSRAQLVYCLKIKKIVFLLWLFL